MFSFFPFPVDRPMSAGCTQNFRTLSHHLPGAQHRIVSECARKSSFSTSMQSATSLSRRRARGERSMTLCTPILGKGCENTFLITYKFREFWRYHNLRKGGLPSLFCRLKSVQKKAAAQYAIATLPLSTNSPITSAFSNKRRIS